MVTLAEAFEKIQEGKNNVWVTGGNQIGWERNSKSNVQGIVVETHVFLHPVKNIGVCVSDGLSSWLVDCGIRYTSYEEIKEKYPRLAGVKGTLQFF